MTLDSGSGARRRPRLTGLVGLTFACLAAALLVTFGPGAPGRAVGALPLVLFLPGVGAWGLPDRSSPNAAPGLGALIVIMSVALTVLDGVALAASGEFSRPALAISLAGLSLILGVLRLHRAPNRPDDLVRDVAAGAPPIFVVLGGLAAVAVAAAAIVWSVHSTDRNLVRASTPSLWSYEKGARLLVGVDAGPSQPAGMTVRVMAASAIIQSWAVPKSPADGRVEWLVPEPHSPYGLRIILLVGSTTVRTLDLSGPGS
jgi:hypothetical protein